MNQASQTITDYIAKQPEWQQANLTQFRELVHDVEPTITEDWKWNVPILMLDGRMLFSMAAFKAHTKYNFIANGATLDDGDTLFNNGLDSKTSRSIDLRENETLDQAKLRALVMRAVAAAKQK